MTLGTVQIAIIVDTKEKVDFNLNKVIQSRVLVEGDSGSGKSYFICDIVEKTHGKIQQIIIDPEGEYFPLRNTFDDYLLIGKSTDIVKVDIEINVKYAKKLVDRILESGANVILDLSEIPEERVHFVKEFLNSIINASKNLRHPVLLIIEEGQIFAPEKGHGESESLNAVVNIATRGRKRGIGLIVGTQAIAAFNKDVVRQLKTRIIGNCTLDNDMKRAAADLGFTKERLHELRELGDDHHFFAYGPGIEINGKKPKEIIKIKALENKTELYNFQDNVAVILKNPKKIQSIAAEFIDIAAEVEKEVNEKKVLEAKIAELTSKLANISKTQSHVDPNLIADLRSQMELEKKQSFDLGKYEGKKEVIDHISKFTDKLKTLDIALKIIEKQAKDALLNIPIFERPTLIKPPATAKQAFFDAAKMIDPKKEFNAFTTKKLELGETVYEGDLQNFPYPKGGAMRLLKAAKMFYPKSITRNQACLFADLSPTSGSTDTYLSELRSKNLIIDEEKQVHKITELGLKIAGEIDSLPQTNEQLQNLWISRLSGKEKNILKILCEIYPDSIDKESLCNQSGMKYMSDTGKVNGSYATYLSKLRSNGLMINSPGDKLQASKELFPEQYA